VRYFEKKKYFFSSLLYHNEQKWSRKVNPHIWGITTPKVGEADVEIEILKTVVCLAKRLQETKIKLREIIKPKALFH